MMIKNVRHSTLMVRRLFCIFAVLLAMLGIAGCTSISPAPFTAFTTSIQQLRDGADASLSLVHERTRGRFIVEAAGGDVAKVEALLLTQPPEDPFGWTSVNTPLFLKAARFKEGVYQLNSVLVTYAGLLGQLASPELVSPDKFDELAKELNGNLRNTVQMLGISSPQNKEIALFSTIATTAFRVYLQNRQRKSLIEALNSNQPAMQDMAVLGASAVRLTAAAMRNEYNLSSAKLAEIVGESTVSISQKQAAIRDLVQLDENFIKEMSILRILHQSYMGLQAAHAELATGVANPKLGLPMIIELLENGRHLYRLYEELSKEDKTKVAGGAS